MDKTGYAIECTKCGSTAIEKSEPIMEAVTNTMYQTLTCTNCNHEVKEII